MSKAERGGILLGFIVGAVLLSAAHLFFVWYGTL